MHTTPTVPTAPPAPTIHPLDRILAAYRATLDAWTGWTWQAAPGGGLLVEGPGPLDTAWAWTQWEDACAAGMCARGTDAVEGEWAAEAAREYGERCQEDAEAAAAYARRAVDEAMRGHLQTAITLAREAWDRERPYDVGSAYSPLYTALSSARDDIGSAWDDE